MNFFGRYYEVQKRQKRISKQTMIQIGIVGALILLTLNIFIAFTLTNQSLQIEIDQLNAAISTLEIQEKLKGLEEKEKILTNATRYYNGILTATQKLNTWIKPDQTLFDSIINLLPSGMMISDFSYHLGNITLACTADSNEKIAQYVHRLKNQEHIIDVAYDGYTKGESDYKATLSLNFKSGGKSYANHQ